MDTLFNIFIVTKITFIKNLIQSSQHIIFIVIYIIFFKLLLCNDRFIDLIVSLLPHEGVN